MKIALVFDHERPDTVGIYFARALQALGIAYDHWWLRDGARIPRAYDLYLRIDHGDYRRDLPAELEPKIFYAVDTHLPGPWKGIRRAARRYALVCCAHRRGAGQLSNGVWVPLGCDSQLHGRQPGSRDLDLAFVGTEGGIPRKIYLQALRERYPNSWLQDAPHTDMGTIYSRARIGFNYSIRDDVNMRVFEILASGTLLLTNRLSHDELECLGLREGEHYVAYRSPGELIDLIAYYLAHPTEREGIAAAGMAVALERHTYAHRVRQIIALVRERLKIVVPGVHVEAAAV